MPHEIASSGDEAIEGYVGGLVLDTARETINAPLDEGADQLVNAGRYERTDERQAYRSGHCKRTLVVSVGEVGLSVPKLRDATFAAQVIERYRRRESSAGEVLMGTCLVTWRRFHKVGLPSLVISHRSILERESR